MIDPVFFHDVGGGEQGMKDPGFCDVTGGGLAAVESGGGDDQ